MLLAGDYAAGRIGDDQNKDVQSERVGPMATSYFYPRRRSQTGRLLGDALFMVSQWLEGADIVGSVVTGTDAKSEFADRDRYGRTEGIG